jgi:putative Holliday junction resolvase
MSGLPAAALARAPLRPASYLALDFGTRRTGVASGNALTRSATPLVTLALEGEARFAAIGRLIGEWRPDALVVGVPRHPDGAVHDLTRLAQRFARQLHGRFRLPVHEVDERYSTVEAEANAGRAGHGRAGVDAAAAAILLEQFLNDPPA